MIGSTLGSFRIIDKLGEGGMGVVYRAQDIRLDREVAVKVLPEDFLTNPERIARFQREAKVLAAMNHPSIASIYEFGEIEGTHFLVMELAPGETLSDRIERGPILSEEVLSIGLQIAEALEAAHQAGVIHRDLKPANVMVDSAGAVRVLDFGLAKALDPAPAKQHPDATRSPTLTLPATQAGVILGTAAYMSPEQARGQDVDERSDLWAFGVILWEMLTGRRLFEGESVSDILAAVLRSDLDWDQLPTETPAGLRRLLSRCLVRDPRNRLHHAADARIEIQQAIASDVPEAVLESAFSGRRSVLWALAAGLVVVIMALIAALLFQRPDEPAPITLSLLPPEDSSFIVGDGPVTLSPDGRQVAVVVQGDHLDKLAIRRLDSDDYRMLPIVENTLFDPFWAPDGRFLGYFHWDGTLKKISAGGGPAVSLADGTDPRGGTWNQEGIILFAPSVRGPLFRVSADGGQVDPVTTLDSERGEVGHWRPHFLPDGRRFLYLAFSGNDSPLSSERESAESNATRRDTGMSLWVGSLEGDAPRLIPGSFESAVSYAAPGYLLFLRDGTLMARPFDLGNLSWRSEAVALARDVASFPGWGTPAFSVSKTGVLAYHRQAAPPERKLVWRDRKGAVISELVVEGAPANLDLSPDDTRAAVQVTGSSRNRDIWVVDLERGARLRFTFGTADEEGPVWSPDGQRIAFRRSERGKFHVLSKAATGSGSEELLFESDGYVEAVDWSSDGRFLLFEGIGLWGDLWVLPLIGDREPVRFVSTPFGEHSGRFSPDGRWIAYTSDETGRPEIYIQSWPSERGRWLVSTAGGDHPRWREDGKEVFYRDPAGRLMALSLEISEEGHLHSEPPRPLFELRSRDYEPSQDGQRFLIVEPIDEGGAQAATVVLNWSALLSEEY